MLDELTTSLKNNQNLSFEEMTTAMNEILQGKYKDEVIANFLQNLTSKGETDDELLAMLNKMNQFSVSISPNCKSSIIDMCGTGWVNLKKLNISKTQSYFL